MPSGIVTGIFIARKAEAPMEELQKVEAIAGQGLLGDRYATGHGSYNRGEPGKRQVTLIREEWFPGTSFAPSESRRNIVIRGTELYWLIDRWFTLGTAILRGVKYCEPCLKPGALIGNGARFEDEFSDRGGLIAEVLQSGNVALGDYLIRPQREDKEWPPVPEHV
jgi:MOSC domain-containing protein YiiM